MKFCCFYYIIYPSAESILFEGQGCIMKKNFALTLTFFMLLGLLSDFPVLTYAADEQFEWVVPCEWAHISEFSEGLAVVQGYNAYGSKGLCGFIDKFSKIQIPLEWEDVKLFSEGLAPARVGNKWGYINTRGEVVIEPQFDGAGMFSENRAWVKTKGENGWKYGFINKNGEMVIEFLYSAAKPFREGVAAVCMDNRWGFIAPDGQVAIDFSFGWANSFQDGYAVVEFNGPDSFNTDKKVIDQNGSVVLKRVEHPFHYDVKNQTMWIFYDKLLEKNDYHSSSSFRSDILVKAIKNPENILHKEETSNPRVFYSEKFSIFVVFANPEIHFFDSSLNFIRTVKDISWIDFNSHLSDDGIFAVSKTDSLGGDTNQGYIDIRGNMVIEPCFWQAQNFHEGRGVVCNTDGKYGVIRISDDGELYAPQTECIDTAYPAVMDINGASQNIYMINGYGYIDVDVLPKYGLNVTKTEHKNIFITRNFVHRAADVSDAFQWKDTFEVYSAGDTVYVGDKVANAYIIDDKTAVWIDDLNVFGTMVWNNDTKRTAFFVDMPYLQNEGILWESVTDPNGISSAVYREGYYIFRNPQGRVSVYDSNLNFLFEAHRIRGDVSVYKGIFRFCREAYDCYYTNEQGEVVPEPEEFVPYVWPNPFEAAPDPYPELRIEGRVYASSGIYHSWGTVKYYDENGQVVLDENWSDAQPFVNGTALVMAGGTLYHGSITNGLWGLIDTNGNYLVEPKWTQASRYADGKIRAQGKHGEEKAGLFDERGNELLPMKYEIVNYTPGSDHAIVSHEKQPHDGRLYGMHLVDLHNNTIIPLYFNSIEEQPNGTFEVTSWNGANIVRMIDMPLLKGEVFVNSEKVDFDTPPLLINSRTVIPVRAAFEKVGCEVQWLNDSKTAVITLGDMRVEIKQDTNSIIKNGKYIYSDTAAFNYRNRIYVPLRVISEALGGDVFYDDATGNVLINYY